MKRAIGLGAAAAITAVTATPALADLTYRWHTLTETVNGLPVTPDATGSITLTQAAVITGSAAVASAPGAPGFATYSFNGVDAIDFGAFFGPGLNGIHYSMVNGGSLMGAPLFNANLAVVGFLDYTGGNNSFGGFAVNLGDTDAYFAVGNGATWTIGFGTDNSASPAYGGKINMDHLGPRVSLWAALPLPALSPVASVAIIGLVGSAAFALLWFAEHRRERRRSRRSS